MKLPRLLLRLTLLTLIALGLADATFAQRKAAVRGGPSANDAGMDAARLAAMQARMRSFVERGTIPGMVTLVARRGRVVSLAAHGVQDYETKTPMRADSLFQIASMTKPITAIGVMVLMEEGRLALSDPVSKHLPEFADLRVSAGSGAEGLKKPARAITIRDLMTHTSGMSGSYPAGRNDKFYAHDEPLADAVRAYARAPLAFEPGARWGYSNTGIAALGRIIEVVSGQPYEQFMHERIFAPLGLRDTHFFVPENKRGRVASIYQLADGKLKKVDLGIDRMPVKYAAPEGGLYSTAHDLFRLYQMMLDGGALDGRRILSKLSVEQMTAVHTGEMPAGFVPGMGYGLAWNVVARREGTFRLNSVGTFGHGGAYKTYGFVDPKQELIGVILMQRVSGDGDLSDEVNAFTVMTYAAITE
jgi:CubicO group peptidase (beta-lactamase class C family)